MWQDTKEKKRKDEMATRGTLTSSFTRHQSPGTTLKLKDPSSLSVNSNVACSCTWEEEEENDPENPAKISILNGKPEAEDVVGFFSQQVFFLSLSSLFLSFQKEIIFFLFHTLFTSVKAFYM